MNLPNANEAFLLFLACGLAGALGSLFAIFVYFLFTAVDRLIKGLKKKRVED